MRNAINEYPMFICELADFYCFSLCFLGEKSTGCWRGNPYNSYDGQKRVDNCVSDAWSQNHFHVVLAIISVTVCWEG